MQSTAQTTTSYALYSVRNDSRNGSGARSKINLKFAIYDESNPNHVTVTLVPAHALGANQNYQLVVLKNGIMDRSLNQIHGDPNHPAQANNYSTYFARGTSLNYTDRNGDRVKLNLHKGGFMDLFRNFQGDATLLALQQTSAGASVLNGSVVRQGPDADGVTTIAALTGSSGVQNLLHDPPFSIASIS